MAEHKKNMPHKPVNMLFVSRNARVLQRAFGNPCLEYSAVKENVLISEINHKPPKKMLLNIVRYVMKNSIPIQYKSTATIKYMHDPDSNKVGRFVFK